LAGWIETENALKESMDEGQKQNEDGDAVLDSFHQETDLCPPAEEASFTKVSSPAEIKRESAYRVLRYKLLAFLRCKVEPECQMLEDALYEDETGAGVKHVGDMARKNVELRNQMLERLERVESAMSDPAMFELQQRAEFLSEVEDFKNAHRPPPQVRIAVDHFP
jgi:hypothetical protein